MAADLLREHGQFDRAAAQYLSGDLFVEAADCYHLEGQHERAAAALRRGCLFNKLVSYVRA